MKGTSYIRRSLLLLVTLVFMVALAACDTTPATPVPAPTATAVPPTTAPVLQATTAPVAVATSTTASTTSGQQANPTPGKGKLSSVHMGVFSELPKQSPKGDLASRSIAALKASNSFDTIEPARTTPTRQSAEPTATEVVNAPTTVPDGWSVVLDSDFSTGDAGTWIVGDGGDVAATVENGAYNLLVKNNYSVYTSADEISNWTDGYISATLQIKGSGFGGVSARFTSESKKFTDVVCRINNAGKFGCYKELAGQTSAIATGNSSAIKRNASNTIALLAIGTNFTFFINGKVAKSFVESDITEGAWE